MPESSIDLVDLLDLKMLPAWVTEPAEAQRYPDMQGEDNRGRPAPRHREERRRKIKPSKLDAPLHRGRRGSGAAGVPGPRSKTNKHTARRAKYQRSADRHQRVEPIAPRVAVRFLPHTTALERVVAQIKSSSVAYSLFALARLFLEKPTRYDVRLTASANSVLFQLGEDGTVGADRQFLEGKAFRFAQADFYKIDITETEPLKGNFTNVARCKLSGTLLGPTNHHDYQRRLRNLYEQRFSRRLSFAEYQRQIEIISEPGLLEQWKEDARKVTTFTTLRENAPVTFASPTEAERHFRQNYLPGLVRSVSEAAIGGVESRGLHDRRLHRAVENEWMRETRSPSRMMQELAAQFRQTGLHVFRHRRGMLFVSSIRPRALAYDGAALSPLVQTILETLREASGMNRKELAEKLIARPDESVARQIDPAEEGEARKLALASDLRWLISEGYVIEFNDGTLDLPRAKAPNRSPARTVSPAREKEERVEAGAPPTEEEKPVVAAVPAAEETEIGGS